MAKIDKWKIEKKLQRALAIDFVSEYCNNNNLSIEKLKKQRFELSYEECGFFQPSDVKPEGLTNDIDTMPILTLVIKLEDEQLLIIETPDTKKYLGND